MIDFYVICLTIQTFVCVFTFDLSAFKNENKKNIRSGKKRQNQKQQQEHK